MLGQNRWSNCWVEFTGQITGQICRSNLSVKFLVQIPRSNCWGKLLGPVTPNVTPVTPNVTPNARKQTHPILGLHRASLGQRMATPSNGPKTGKDGRGRGKEKAALCGRGLAWIRSEGDQWVLYVTLKVSLFQQARHEPHTLP